MIIVKLMGGLGNQMFQYAFGKNFARKTKTELKFDLSEFENTEKNHVQRNYDLDIFNVKAEFATNDEVFRLSKRTNNRLIDRILNRAIGFKKSFILEPHFHFSETVFDKPDNIYLHGYWQSAKYFAEIEPQIRQDFTFREEMTGKAKEMLEKITNANSVCVNVRRGDFVTNDFHGSLDTDYFRNAESIIKTKTRDETYFVFSDEVEWCEANLKFDASTVFVSHDYAGRKFQDYLRLMAACKNFVIPNSSFAWWAVWFNNNKDRTVIAPKKWFGDPNFDTKDLIPPNWIRV